jgi:hypothetical protein
VRPTGGQCTCIPTGVILVVTTQAVDVYAMLRLERPKEGLEDDGAALRILIAVLLLEPVPGQVEFQVSGACVPPTPFEGCGQLRSPGRQLRPYVCGYNILQLCQHTVWPRWVVK